MSERLIGWHVDRNPSTTNLKNRAIYASMIAVVLIVSFFLNPARIPFSICLFHRLTGLGCPTCGLSRSFYAISHFHLQEAFAFHWMGPIVYFAFLILFFKFSFETTARRTIQVRIGSLMMRIAIIVFLALWFGCWVVRLFGEMSG